MAVTAFQNRVYQTLTLIPRGKVTTYKELARKLGCDSCQTIGQALRRNPYAPEVPCHRVISTKLTIGGYSGEIDGEQIAKKLALLAEEGVYFIEGRLADTKALFRF